jgi:hypothetical protein
MRAQACVGRARATVCPVQKHASAIPLDADRAVEQNRNKIKFGGLPMLHPSLSPLASLLAATSFALASASGHACELSEPQKGTVAEVKDGETLQLTDRTVVRLVNAKAPTALIATRDDRRRPCPSMPQAPRSSSAMEARAPTATGVRSRKSMW